MSNIILDGSFVRIPISPTLKTKVQIVKGDKIDTYTILKDAKRNVFPLQYGVGTYSIRVYQNISGNRYNLSLSKTIIATNTSECYLKPSQYVWYSDEIQKLSDEINADNPNNRLSAYYNYCYKKISYDYIKALLKKKTVDYVPELDKVIKKHSGICFDKAALFCALCRINNIQCKLVIGYVNKKTYHAWCQVKIGDKWKLVDPTMGIKYKASDYKTERTC